MKSVRTCSTPLTCGLMLAVGLAARPAVGMPDVSAVPPLGPSFLREIAAAGLPEGPGDASVVAEAELAELPPPARRYLRFMGVVGRPRVWAFRAAWKGRVRPGPHHAWDAAEAWQYDTSAGLARYVVMRTTSPGALPVTSRDVYLDGQSRRREALLGVVPVAGAAGRVVDADELVSYLADAALLAPTMLLRPEVRWYRLDDEAFELALVDRGHAVSARVTVDERGAPTEVASEDRFHLDPTADRPPVQAGWSTQPREWTSLEDRPVPTRIEAAWRLPGGSFVHADLRLEPGSLVFNVAPGE